MDLRLLDDPGVIEKFLTDPELWGRISEYGQNSEDFSVTLHESISWVGVYEADCLMCILFLHPDNTATGVVHINILKKYRKHSKKITDLLIEYLILSGYKKFNTSVPEIYPDVIKYLVKNGFVYEGTNRKSINKKNKLVDQLNYGITLKELREL